MSDAIQKVAFKFNCNLCDYHTSKKGDFNKHLDTAKHKERLYAIQMSPNSEIKCICSKTFKHLSSLYRHKKKCIIVNSNNKDILNVKEEDVKEEDVKEEDVKEENVKGEDVKEENETKINKDSIVEFIQQNNEIKQLLLKENEELKIQLKEQNKQIM